MRVTTLGLLLACLLLATQAQAAAAKPHVKRGTPYADARAELIHQGFDPVRILLWDATLGKDQACPGWSQVCVAYPEVMNCFVDIPVCQFMYRRRSDGRYWTVNSLGEPDRHKGDGLRSVTYDTAASTPRYWLDDFVVVGPNGRRMQFRATRRETL